MRLATIAGTAKAFGRVLFCSLCFSLVAVPLTSQNRQSAAPPAATPIRSVSTQVNLYAIVHDKRGRLVSSLQKSDFELSEDGSPQQILNFSRETNVPLSLGILIDTSPSQGRLLEKERDSAKLFLHSVLKSTDQAFVLHFDVDVEVLQDFTNASNLLTQSLDELQINETGQSILKPSSATSHTGATRLYDAVYLASNELMKTRYGRKVMVLVTDGDDQGSSIDWRGALEAADKADVIVYTIVIRDPDFYMLTRVPYHGSANTQKVSAATGGCTIQVESAQNLGAAFDQIAAELRSEYLLSYSPVNGNHTGAFRAIRLRVPGQSYTVRARRGYYAPSPK
jgi:VWFA-related protein